MCSWVRSPSPTCPGQKTGVCFPSQMLSKDRPWGFHPPRLNVRRGRAGLMIKVSGGAGSYKGERGAPMLSPA